MSLRNTIIDALNIRPGESHSIALLASYSFLAGICLAYVISLGNAFFLVEFGSEYLAPGYIVTGIVGYITGSLLSVIQKRISFAKLVRLIMVFLFVLTCMFRIGFWFAPDRLLIWGLTTGQLMAGGMFVSIGTYIMLVYFVFRSLSGRLFNLRQGKRLFGLISSGDVISSIIGFFSVPLLIRFFPNAADLLFIAAGSLLLCLWVLSIIARQFSTELDSPQTKRQTTQVEQSSFSHLIKNRYFVLFFLLSAASVFGFYYIDYAFLGQLRVRFPDKAQLAQFIGIFYGVIRIVEFVLKTLLSGWLISQYGLRFGLVALPLLLFITSTFAAISGTLLADATSIVFLLLTLSKLIERVVTKSIYEPSFSGLYQSLDPNIQLSVQTKIEGIVQQLAVVFAGLSLLFFHHLGAFQLVIDVLIVIFAGWALISVLMYRAYRNTLLQNLSQNIEETNTSTPTDVSKEYHSPEHIAQIKEEIKDAIDNATWCMATLLDLNDDNARLNRLKSALGTEIDKNRERIFHLLPLIYEPKHVQLVEHNFKSGSNDGKAYALELIDLFVDQDLKVLLFPLLDDLTLTQRLKRLDPYCPQQHLTPEQRLKDMVNRQPAKIDPWIKICALHAFPYLSSPTITNELVATLSHPDPLLRETAAWSICEIDPTFLTTYIQHLPEKDHPNIDHAFQTPQYHNQVWLTLDKVTFLKSIPLFSHIPENMMVSWASSLTEKQIQSEETFMIERDTQDSIYIIVEGQVRMHTGLEIVTTLDKGDILGHMPALNLHIPATSATANNAVKLCVLDQNVLSDFIDDHPQIAQGMIQGQKLPTLSADTDAIQTL